MNQKDVSIEYTLIGTGWSECSIEIRGQRCTVTASYLSDALRDLVTGTNHMLQGGMEARFSFDEEPGEYRWIMRAVQDRGVSVQILEFAELWGEKPDSEGALIFQAVCPARRLGEALLGSLNSLLEKHGLEGYKEKWVESEFPIEGYMSLCACLGAEPSNHALHRTREDARR